MHNTHFSQFIPPAAATKSAGVWTPGDASHVVSEARGAADGAFALYIPLALPANAAYRAGARLKSIDVFYKIAAAAADDFATVELEKMNLPPSGTAVSGAAVNITLDAGHDTAAERKAIGDHSLTAALSAPDWIDDDQVFVLKLAVDAAATTAFTFYGARANFDLRA